MDIESFRGFWGMSGGKEGSIVRGGRWVLRRTESHEADTSDPGGVLLDARRMILGGKAATCVHVTGGSHHRFLRALVGAL